MGIQGWARCTISSAEKLEPNKKSQDDGWTLITDVRGFVVDKKFVHRGKVNYDHVCAAYGEWAFDPGNSRPTCIACLHYNAPAKFAKMAGTADAKSGAKVFEYSGAEFLAVYQQLTGKGVSAHVWQRDKSGEIAIDFCLPGPKTEESPSSCIVS